jgi:transposase
MIATPQWIGIDVSKKTLDVFSPKLGSFCVANTAKGIDSLVAKLRQIPVAGVVMEATGGYEQAALRTLNGLGLPASVVNPARVRPPNKKGGQASLLTTTYTSDHTKNLAE